MRAGLTGRGTLFTGIIEVVGTVAEVRAAVAGSTLVVKAIFPSGPLEVGESIAISGPCMTVEKVLPEGFQVFASRETLARTTLARARPGTKVNLERALKLGERLGGHFVLGHVDGIGRVRRVIPEGAGRRLYIAAPSDILPMLAFKGSIAVDGVSLTIAELRGAEFCVALVPFTLSSTTLASLKPGDEVNLEADIIARYVHATLKGPILEPEPR